MAQNTSGRMVMLLIGGIPVTMILASTWLWYFVVHGDLDLRGVLGTANQGTLVEPPRQIGDYPLQDMSGQSVDFADLPPHWTIVVPGAGGRCGEACERSLYETRQIHVALGRDIDRLRRLYVSEDSIVDTALTVSMLSDGRPVPGESFAGYLEDEHRGVQTFTLPAPDYRALFPEHSVDKSTWYLVDPAGWVMMSYNGEVSYKDVITDLKFLLKNSSG
jgi:cytochrome oxidase Cu insertion factor (SCO1/SenC/PrrC family)